MLSFGRRRLIREAVVIVRVEEGEEVGRTIALVASEVAGHDEVVDLYGCLADDIVRDVGGKGGPREHFLEYVERQRVVFLIPERAVARHRPHVLAHERVVTGVDVMFR